MRSGGPTLDSEGGDGGHTTRPQAGPGHEGDERGRRRRPSAAGRAASATRAPLPGPDSDDSASSANDRSRADWNRSSDAFSRQRRTMRSSAGGAACPLRASSGGSLDSTARHRVGRRRALERALAGAHLVEHAAEREQVGAGVHALPAHLLGRHVAGRAEHGAGVGDRGACRRRLLEPADATAWARPKSRILTRPSSVTNRFSGLMSRWMIPRRARRPARRRPARVVDRLAHGQRPGCEPLAQRRARQQLEHHVARPRRCGRSRGRPGCWDARARPPPALRARTREAPPGRRPSSTAGS